MSHFYINVFAIDARIISIIFLIGGIWDIINNPLIGVFIDHKNNAKGKLVESDMFNFSDFEASIIRGTIKNTSDPDNCTQIFAV